MSTKLRNARAIAAPIGRAYDMLMAERPRSVALGKGLWAACVAERAAQLVDEARMRGGEAEHPLHSAWIEMHDRARKVARSGLRDPQIDFEFELWLFPLGRRTLVMVHTEQRAMLEWFDALPFVADHSYWDDTDPDEDVPGAAWRRRRRDWERVLPNGSAPSDRCLTMVMYNHAAALPPSARDALRHVPTVESRLANNARRRHLDERHAALLEARRAADPAYEPEGFADLFEAHRLADADPERRLAIRAEIAPAIRTITAADLVGPR